MNIQEWQNRIRDRLTQSTALIQRMVPGMTYGALATATLLPIVDAVKGGDIVAITGLYTLLGNVGAGLITNLIQEWKDREEAETIADLPQAIATQVAEDGNAQTAFDKLITTLETVRLTLESGALPDPKGFVDALQAEARQLGSTVEVHGDWITVGAITNVQNIAIGRNIQQTNIGTQIVQQPPDPNMPDPVQLRTAYLNRLYQQSDMLSLTSVDPKAAGGEAHLSLSAVYTALLTMTPEHHEQWLATEEALRAKERMADREIQRLSAIDLLNRHQYLVLLGDPGSGKSTLVNFVALCLAGAGLAKADANIALLTAPLPVDQDEESQQRNRSQKVDTSRQPWQHGALLPVRVVLRDFASRGLPAPGVQVMADHLWQFICAELTSAALGDYVPLMRNELQRDGGLLLLDGLDEVPAGDQQRSQVKQAVENFSVLFPNCRILVTSRTYAYQQQGWQLRGFTETILAPFTDSQIRHYVDRWYAYMATVRSLDLRDAQGRAELLKRAIFAAPRLHELAERPLLLTLTASLHAWRGGTLPDLREELYDAAVDLLLDWWESQRVVRDATGKLRVVQPSLVEWLKADREAIRAVLNRLAFEAHKEQPLLVGTADIAERDLVYALWGVRGNQAISEEMLLEYLSDRAGLLVQRGVKVYAFPHRTFQEYLAACHLTDEGYPEQVADLVRNEPNRWREVALLAGAKAVRGTASAIWSLVDALCYRQPDEDGYTLADDWGALLAGQALLESANLDKISPRNQRRVDLVCTCLRHVLRNPDFSAIERTEAEHVLSQLNDNHFGSDTSDLPTNVHNYLKLAGFAVMLGSEPSLFSAIPIDKLWRDSVKDVVVVKVVSDATLDSHTVWEVVHDAQNLLGRSPNCIFVICEHTPDNSAWLQISTLRADEVKVMPILGSILIEGEQENRHRDKLLDYLENRFLGPQLDLYDRQNPITDLLNFFGREQLVEQLDTDLELGHAAAIFGLRKMGKTSLLYFLRERLTYPAAVIDLEVGKELEDVYERIIEGWTIRLRVMHPYFRWKPPGDVGNSNSSSRFVRKVRSLLSSLELEGIKAHLAVFIDEIELLYPWDEIDLPAYLDFARTLRGLAQEHLGKFGIIIAGVDPNIVRTNRLFGRQNPFYSFFRMQYMPPLNPDDCKQMIRNIGVQMGLTYEDDAVDFVADISGCHPYWARKLCSLAFQAWKNQREQGPITFEHMSTTARLFVQHPDTAQLLDHHGLWGEVTDSFLWTKEDAMSNESVLLTLAAMEQCSQTELVARTENRSAAQRSLIELTSRSIVKKVDINALEIYLKLFRNWIRIDKLGLE